MEPLTALDPRIAAWFRTVDRDICEMKVSRVTPGPRSLVARPESCLVVHLDVFVNKDDAGRLLGEFLRLLHAASARPVKVPTYDWLQQLLWPSVCMQPLCKCCHDADRRLKITLKTGYESESRPDILNSALFEWCDHDASVEYHHAMGAIQGESRGASPTVPIELTLEVHSASQPTYSDAVELLMQRLSTNQKNDKQWFQVGAINAVYPAYQEPSATELARFTESLTRIDVFYTGKTDDLRCLQQVAFWVRDATHATDCRA